jgi:hypothetical protein
MEIRTTKPHEYVKAEPGMKVLIDWYISDDMDVREYFFGKEDQEFTIESYDNESDIIWLHESEFAIDPELAIKVL